VNAGGKIKMKILRWLPFAFLASLAPIFILGCVTRRFTVDSYPQGATVYKDNTPIGMTPVDSSFVYHGKYKFTLVKDGFETLTVDQPVQAPWYAYPPFDFITENMWPFEIRDHRRLTYTLEPRRVVTHEEAVQKASALRSRGQTLVPLNNSSEPVQPVRDPEIGSAPGIQPLPSQQDNSSKSPTAR